MLRLAFDFIITWRETRTRPNAYLLFHRLKYFKVQQFSFKAHIDFIFIIYCIMQ